MNLIINDVPTPLGIYYQDSGTPNQEGILELHDTIIFYLLLVLGLVSWMLMTVIINYSSHPLSHKYIQHGQCIEIIWTIFPVLILLIIAYPSFILLYLCDEVISPSMTIKAIASQWYWTYEYSDFIQENGESIIYDSYIIPDSILEEGQLRILDTDTSIVIPVDTNIRLIVTSSDVIHDFAVPSLGIKVDATPGRLNQVSALMEREGVYYGQCSEHCGINHSAIPIKIEVVSLPKFLEWLNIFDE
jgi:cytochrome c oxidase subunit 2